MTLLDFARGPGLFWSSIILLAGLSWRLSAVAFLPWRRSRAAPNAGRLHILRGAVATVVTRSFARRGFWPRIALGTCLAYTFHIGLVIILLGGAPHILLIKEAIGLEWSPLPKGIVALVSGLTLAAMLACLIRRSIDPVLRLLSVFDDYLSLGLTILPVLTGILLAEETFGVYEALLTTHILSVEALMVWLPFGKLAHVGTVVLGRAAQGAKFAFKGASS